MSTLLNVTDADGRTDEWTDIQL